MRRNIRFILSLIIILLISWADIHYSSIKNRGTAGPYISQGVHMAVLAATCFIGYLNWREKEKWLRLLWVGLYAGVFMIILLLAIVDAAMHHNMMAKLKAIIAETRNLFEGPLPFLVFSIFIKIAGQFNSRDTGR
ncbi:MAG: hypothetical protein H7257_13030 [Taibaiella sp.]|nr:hypothetical protein [Taibaiella sp.]